MNSLISAVILSTVRHHASLTRHELIKEVDRIISGDNNPSVDRLIGADIDNLVAAGRLRKDNDTLRFHVTHSGVEASDKFITIAKRCF